MISRGKMGKEHWQCFQSLSPPPPRQVLFLQSVLEKCRTLHEDHWGKIYNIDSLEELKIGYRGMQISHAIWLL